MEESAGSNYMESFFPGSGGVVRSLLNSSFRETALKHCGECSQ